MEGISDIRIEGIDNKRPPRIQHKSYIDLFFRLNHQAPIKWCEEFNNIMSGHPCKPRIEAREGLYIQTWVRSVDEIIEHLEQLKEAVSSCTTKYIEKIETRDRAAAAGMDKSTENDSPQSRLNKVISELNFDI